MKPSVMVGTPNFPDALKAKLWGFKVTNTTANYQTVRICRRSGATLIIFPVKPQCFEVPWNASHDAPLIFLDKADCIVQRAEGVSVALEWDGGLPE